MPDEATSATPAAAPAAVVAPPAPALTEPAPDITAPDAKERRLDKQIDRALKAGKAKIAAAKGAPPKGPDGKFQKRAAAAPAAEAATTTEPEKPEPAAKPAPVVDAAPTIEKVRALLEAGDIEAAFEAAFGKKPQDFNINSRKWEEWRKSGDRQKKALAAEREALTASAARDRQELHQTLESAKKELGPLLEGRKLYAAGDYARALKAAFGDDAQSFNKKLLAQHHGKNPEVEQLRRELAAERDAREAEQRKIEEQQAERAQAQKLEAYREELRSGLIDGADPEIAALATKPGFLNRVIQIQKQHYDRATRTTLPAHVAAGMVRDEIVAEFGPVFGRTRDTAVPVETPQPGSKAVSSRKGKAPATSLPQRGAAEASIPGRRLTAQELVDKYTNQARAESGLA